MLSVAIKLIMPCVVMLNVVAFHYGECRFPQCRQDCCHSVIKIIHRKITKAILSKTISQKREKDEYIYKTVQLTNNLLISCYPLSQVKAGINNYNYVILIVFIMQPEIPIESIKAFDLGTCTNVSQMLATKALTQLYTILDPTLWQIILV